MDLVSITYRLIGARSSPGKTVGVGRNRERLEALSPITSSGFGPGPGGASHRVATVRAASQEGPRKIADTSFSSNSSGK
jgi:hypothetical protein